MSQLPNKIRIGSRGSKLALTQVEEVKKLLAPHSENLILEVVIITTSGDKIQDRNLSEVGGKGLFIKELEEALVQGKIDLAIHSAKDVPPLLSAETEIVAFTKRFDARDCFISKKFTTISDLPKGAVVGTSSARRKAIILGLRPDLKVVNFRGNVDTRLKKIENDEVDATILAVCGLERLAQKSFDEAKCPKGYNFPQKPIDKSLMLPAGGQGALAIQIKKSATALRELIAKINHHETEICVRSEREFLLQLQASCATPVAVHATVDGDVFNLETKILDFDGSQSFSTNLQSKANAKDAILLAKKAAQQTKEGAQELLRKICHQD